MNKCFWTVGIWCLLAGSAVAEPVTLSVNQAIAVAGALQLLDGHDQIVKEGGNEKAVKVSYVLSGTARLAIARDLTKLRVVISDFSLARQGKLTEIGGPDGIIKPGSPEDLKLGQELTAMLGQKQDLDLVKLTLADLGLMPPAANPIPPSVLSDLSQILDDKTP